MNIGSGEIRYLYFLQNSPETRDGIFSFHVDYGGIVGNYYQHVDGSYGMIYITNKNLKFRSPNLYNDYGNACQVVSGGNVHYSGWNVTDSYGRSPDTIGPSYSKDVTYTGEVMGNYANGSVGDSYGICSPNRNYDNHACNVYQSGVVDVDSYVYWDSYGIQ